jgi:hypothetical protein
MIASTLFSREKPRSVILIYVREIMDEPSADLPLHNLPLLQRFASAALSVEHL